MTTCECCNKAQEWRYVGLNPSRMVCLNCFEKHYPAQYKTMQEELDKADEVVEDEHADRHYYYDEDHDYQSKVDQESTWK